MFNRSEIMKAAWARFRAIPTKFSPSQIKQLLRHQLPRLSAHRVVDGKRPYPQAANEAQLAAKYGAKAEEAKSILGAIDALNYKPWRINIVPAQAALRSQLQALA